MTPGLAVVDDHWRYAHKVVRSTLKMNRSLIVCVYLAILVGSGNEISGTKFRNGEDSTADEKFVPTSEWQTVRKGQPLPAGLHYRLNIYTGETEVKLLDTSKQNTDSKTDLVSVSKDEGLDDGHEAFYLSKEELKRVLADIKTDGDSQEQEESLTQDKQNVKANYRSYEDLKREFGSLNLTVKTDMEIILELVSKGKQQLISKDDEEATVTTLKDLEYLVHQIDNAREFIRLGGLVNVIIPALNSSSPKVRAESLWLLGSAAQSNPKVQIAILDVGIISKLIKLAVMDSDSAVNAKAIYALSCLTRQFPAAQTKMIDEGGLAALSKIVDSDHYSDFRTKMRVITLINDLMLERISVRKATEEFKHESTSTENEAAQKILQHKRGELKEKLRQYNEVSLEKRLVADGWCNKVAEFLCRLHESGANSGRTQRRDDLGSVVSKDVPYRPEHDAVEKVTSALCVMKDVCHDEFLQHPNLKKVIEEFLLWYRDLSLREEMLQKQSSNSKDQKSEEFLTSERSQKMLDHNDFYYTSIAETLQDLLNTLNKKNAVVDEKDEL